tara:strand:+ start:44887 stop:45693 length:807 start_codon:yes stop_codon:yes gene_type:complete
MSLKINLHGDSFSSNIVDGKISSTHRKKPRKIEFVTDLSSNINLFVDSGIYTINNSFQKNKNYGWLLESKSIRPDLIEYFLDNTIEKVKPFIKIFTHNLELISSNQKFEFLHPTGYWVNEEPDNEKSKLVSMIVSKKKMTTLQKKRVKFAKKNSKKIDIYGLDTKYIETKEEGLSNYYFSYAFENDDNDDYFSEKILDCFATKTIPIYLGTKNITKYFNKEGIIFFDNHNFKDLSIDLYKEKIDAVNENYEKVKLYRSPEDLIYEKIK